MRLVSVFGALGCATLVSSTAFAQSADREPGVDLRGYRMPMDTNAGMYLEPATSPDTGEVTAGMRLNYAFRPIVLHAASSSSTSTSASTSSAGGAGDRKYSLIEHQLTADLAINVGLFHVLAIGVDIPAVVAQTGDDVSSDPAAVALVGSSTVPRTAVGDPALVVKATLLKPARPDAGVALGILDRLTVPLGDHTSYLSDQAVTDEARLLFDAHFLKFLTARVNAGAKLRGHTGSLGCDGSSDCSARFGHELLWGGGLALDSRALGLPHLDWFGEVRGYLPLAPVHPFQSRLPSGTFASLSARYGLRDVGLFAGTEVALDSGIGNAPFRITLGVTFAPRDHDRDHDGVDDEVDRCPDRPEDRDGVEDDDGCPEGPGDAVQCDAAGVEAPAAKHDAEKR